MYELNDKNDELPLKWIKYGLFGKIQTSSMTFTHD